MVRQTLYKNAWPKKAIDDIRNLLYKKRFEIKWQNTICLLYIKDISMAVGRFLDI